MATLEIANVDASGPAYQFLRVNRGAIVRRANHPVRVALGLPIRDADG